MTDPDITPTGTSSVLRLGTIGSTLLLVLFCGTQVLLFSTNLLPNEALDATALALTLAAAVILALPGDPLPLARTIFVTLVPTADAVLMSFALPPDAHVGYAGWHLGASSFLMFFLALRGRSTWAWAGLLAMCGVTIAWTVSIGAGAPAGINLVVRHLGILLIGTLFAVGFRRTTRNVAVFNRTEVTKATVESAAQATLDERHRRSAELENSARAALERIAAGGEPTAKERAGYLLLEARLRDSVRARGLHFPPLIGATTAARQRGVEVTLLDDSSSDERNSLVIEAIAKRLDASNSGRFTARLLPAGRGWPASITEDDGARSRVLQVDRTGRVSVHPTAAPE